MNASREDHERVIVDQFTRQADQFRAFAEMPGQARDMVLAATQVNARDSVLDVACGPGVTTCDLAEVAGRAVGIDVTPPMIEQAKELQRRKNLTNVKWHVGAVPPLPFDDEAFSLVFTRYSFHHFPNPADVLKEIVRVCSATGTVVVMDVFMTSKEQAIAYNHLEKLRDPSHIRALQLAEFEALFVDAGLQTPRKLFYKQPMSLERLLRGSFPNPGDAERVRQIIAVDDGKDELGLGVHRREGDFHFAYPIAVFAGRKITSV
jgi:ubiquinone/menaquinone biosynthesis C-methylase UbiE